MTKKRWTPDDVQKMLTNPVYAGVGPCPAIVEEEVWLESNVRLIEEIGARAVIESVLARFREVFAGLDAPDGAEYVRQAADEAEAALRRLLVDLRAQANAVYVGH